MKPLTLEQVLAMEPEPAPIQALCPECDRAYEHCPHDADNPPRISDEQYVRDWCAHHTWFRRYCACKVPADARRPRTPAGHAPIPPGPPPILRWLAERGEFQSAPKREPVIHPDAERMLREWNEAIGCDTPPDARRTQ